LNANKALTNQDIGEISELDKFKAEPAANAHESGPEEEQSLMKGQETGKSLEEGDDEVV